MKKTISRIKDLRQLKFLELYLTPNTAFFSNARASAIEAGYGPEYADNILNKDLKWLREGIYEMNKGAGIEELKQKARKVLNKSLDSEDENVAQNTAKFIADRLDEDFQKNKPVVQVEITPIFGGKSNEGMNEV